MTNNGKQDNINDTDDSTKINTHQSQLSSLKEPHEKKKPAQIKDEMMIANQLLINIFL